LYLKHQKQEPEFEEVIEPTVARAEAAPQPEREVNKTVLKRK
jgi:hypothetical protein